MASRSMGSFNSPGDAANGDSRPASILLNQTAYIAEFRIGQPPDITEDSNETTATAKSKGGHTMAVTFWVADPPDMSFFSVVCSKPPDFYAKSSNFRSSPHVVGAEGRFVLLRARFFSRYYRDELFMYTAGDTESPSLERVPLPDDDDADPDDFTTPVDCLHAVSEFGIVPRGVHYLVAALCDAHDTSLDFQLHIYSSESKTWSSSTLPNTRAKKIKPDKVITLGEGVLGWVDLSHGLLVCNLCQEPPSACFIPLPRPSLANRDRLRLPGASPRLFRDLTCVDGKLKFIEMEHGDIPEKLSDPCDSNVLYDSDLIRLLDSEDMDDKSKSRHGWRAMTWSRTVSSNCWFKDCTLDVADILVDESMYYLLLSALRGETVGKLKFRELYSVFPTLSIDNSDILYLKSAVEPCERKCWVVAVDFGKRTVKALEAYPFENHDPAEQAFRTSTLSCHLAITPGTRASAYRKITQVGGSANSPHNAAIRVDKHADKHVSRQSRSEVQSLMREKLEKLKRIQDESQSSTQNDQSRMKQQRLLAEPLNKAPNIVQNDHVSQVHPVQNNHEKLEKLKRMWHESQSSMQNDQSRMKQPRLPAEKIPLPLNEDPYLSIVHDDRVSQVHHVQNNLPPQQCFNKWGQPLLPGRSYFPQQNDLICFNMLYGFRGYAPVASTPVHGYGNNQPLWHQPPPWTQQLSQFEHHKASCFNKHNGASYHGYAQQLPAGTHSVYGNNQQQWQSLPPIYNPPASGSWQHPPPVHHPCQPIGVWTS